MKNSFWDVIKLLFWIVTFCLLVVRYWEWGKRTESGREMKRESTGTERMSFKQQKPGNSKQKKTKRVPLTNPTTRNCSYSMCGNSILHSQIQFANNSFERQMKKVIFGFYWDFHSRWFDGVAPKGKWGRWTLLLCINVWGIVSMRVSFECILYYGLVSCVNS